MKKLSKHIALFLALVVLSNGLLAAQMTVTMIDTSIQVENTEVHEPCHGDTRESVNNESIDCCEGDCSSCLLTSNVSEISALNTTVNLQAPLVILTTNHLLPAHRANLYRPPILI
ncbi:MAG: hypothetical protein K6L73_11025 [Cellvibrionaceae bacterium]